MSPLASTLAAFQALPPGGAVLVSNAEVGGDGPCLLGLMCATYNCSINYYWVNMGTGLSVIGTTSDANLKLLYLLNDLKMDAVARYVSPSSTRLPFARQTTAVATYQYVLFTTLGSLPVKSLQSRIWFWITPFTPGLWGILAASLVFATVFMVLLETVILGTEDDLKELQEKLGIEHLAWWRQGLALIAHSLFAHSMSLTTIKDQEPVTLAGKVCHTRMGCHTRMASNWWYSHRVRQVYTIGKSFTWWIVMAAYLATMAAILANVPQPVQLLNVLGDFITTGTTMCMRAGTPASTTIPAIFPAATQAVIAQTSVPAAGIVAGQPQIMSAPGQSVPGNLSPYGSTSASQVADAIVAGYCQGAVLQSTDASYLLNNGDPYGNYCSLTASGPPSDASFPYVFVFTGNTTQLPAAVFDAINGALMSFQIIGSYFNQCQNVNVFNGRQPGGPCASYLATQQLASVTNTVKPLEAADLSGLFAVQAIGAGAAIVLTFLQLVMRWEINHHHGRGCIGSGKSRDKIPGESEKEEEEEEEEEVERKFHGLAGGLGVKKPKAKRKSAPSIDEVLTSPLFTASVKDAVGAAVREAMRSEARTAPAVGAQVDAPVAEAPPAEAPRAEQDQPHVRGQARYTYWGGSQGV